MPLRLPFGIVLCSFLLRLDLSHFVRGLSGTMSNDNKDAASAAMKTDSDADDAASATSSSSSGHAIDFLTWARGLKTTPRTGWVMRQVPNPESVADHSWRITLMAMLASSKESNGVDTAKCIKMALVHDLAEASVGDITPHCGISSEEKHALELEAMTQKTSALGMCGDEILSLWREYEEGTSAEAKLCKDMDKLEMILQAQEYESDGKSGKSLDQFFTSTRGKWQTPLGEAWAKEIEARRTMDQNQSKSNDKEEDDNGA